MMKLRTYASFSLFASIAAIYHAFHSREQFYPAMVYLSTSKICFVLLLNMGLVMMCTMWQFVKRLFLGTLREAEVERLNEQAWREVMEILFAITIFRQDFSVTSLLHGFTALLLIKALHWLAQKRVEYIETTPSVSLVSHIRMVSFIAFLFAVDCLSFRSSFKSLIQAWPASLSLFFSFEYMILATTTISTFLKYAFYVYDVFMEGQWEKKAVFTFYLELVRDLVHLTSYICFFLMICANYNPPLHLIRELYETSRSFKNRISDYIRYRKVTSNMDERFPDATPEELNVSDATCIICREEMVTAKKLLCGHLFHVHCLRSWLERQNTCPTCRALVDPSESGPSRSSRQGGEIAASTSRPNPEGRAAGDHLSQHQARLEAASFAASIYGKSSIYPSTNTLLRSPEYSLLPPVNILSADTSSPGFKEQPVGESASGQLHQHQFSVSNVHSHILMPSLLPGSSFNYGERALDDSDLNKSGAYETSIETRIEALIREKHALQQQLETELQILWQQKENQSKGTSLDDKVKAVAVSNEASGSTTSASG
ncbi:ERAD-associated E3 ubiquitin-protein ligase HRD1B-like [Asparagus officinalis]|uniref:ERAD-associated E3 ubiquitin-protein ligase HRD1B-like n=1 Tax=Asparagus officinalis TaxID=4686 RepID=UPI00098E2847|nr:ERAD-associated E3 ubiquitin-protein ligase HRD1B-like [Asparagus officinalis]